MLLFTLILVIIAVFLMIWYFPIWEIIGMIPGRFGYLFISESSIGLFLFNQIAQTTSPILYYILLFAPTILLLTFMFDMKKKKSNISDKNMKVNIIVGLVMGIIMTSITFASLANATMLLWYSTIIYMVYLIMIYLDRVKDGIDKGKEAAKVDPKKKFGRIWGKIMFYYFVVKVVLSAYKAYSATDPIAAMMNTSSGNPLGSLGPILLAYGIPQIVLDILNVVFADWLTIILLLITMLQALISLDKEKRTIGGIFRTILLATILYFIPSLINLPFYTLILALLYISSWFIGYYLLSKEDKWGIQVVGAVITATALITILATFFLSSFF